MAVLEEPAQLAQALGLRVTDSNSGIQVQTVLRLEDEAIALVDVLSQQPRDPQ